MNASLYFSANMCNILYLRKLEPKTMEKLIHGTQTPRNVYISNKQRDSESDAQVLNKRNFIIENLQIERDLFS